MRKEAQAYAELGWPVFRVRPNSKKPYDRWRNGPTYATTDEGQIHVRWSEMPDANIGIETGRSAFDEYRYLAVLDVDRYEGMTLALEELADGTYSVLTPSGGIHYYFYTERPVKNSVSAMGDGIDVRGAGGMVLAPPSVTPVGPYVLYNDNCVKSVFAEQLEPKASTARYAADSTASFLRDSSAEGGRNNYIASACGSWLHDWDGTGDKLDALDEYAQRVNLEDCKPPLSGYEVSRTAISMYTRHIKGLNNGR